MIIFLPIRISCLSSRVNEVSQSTNKILSGSQKRTVFSLVNQLSSKIKKTSFFSSNKREVKENVCIKPTKKINSDIQMKEPLFRGLVSSTCAIGTDRLIKNQLKHQTSLTSTEKVRLPQNVVHSILDQTLDVRDISTGIGDKLEKLHHKKRFSSFGLMSLDPASSMNRNINVLHQKVKFIPHILSDVVSSPCFQSDISLFVTIFIGLAFQEDICPLLLLERPLVLFSSFYSVIKEFIQDCYVNYVCITHLTPSPCMCGEPFNEAFQNQYPKMTVDPLNIHEISPHTRVKSVISTLGSMILIMILMEKSGCTEMVLNVNQIPYIFGSS